MFNNDLPKIIRGRTAGSQNLLHLGFRYSKSGKLTQDGRQAWRCVKKDDRCPGRVYTDSSNNLTSFKQPHCHGPDLADCELHEVFSNVADLAENTHTAPYLIHCSTTGGISEETRSKLPSEDAIKKRAQRTRRKKNPRPTAPTCLADLQIDDDDCTSLAGDLMLFQTTWVKGLSISMLLCICLMILTFHLSHKSIYIAYPIVCRRVHPKINLK